MGMQIFDPLLIIPSVLKANFKTKKAKRGQAVLHQKYLQIFHLNI